MNYWLLKSEPDEFGIDDLQKLGEKPVRWSGIRNYQARNILRDQLQLGDYAFIYHSSCREVGIAGIARIVSKAYVEPEQFETENRYFDVKSQPENPRWYSVDIRFERKFDQVMLLSNIKKEPQLAEMVLVKQGRLSVQPVTAAEWSIILGTIKTQTERRTTDQN